MNLSFSSREDAGSRLELWLMVATLLIGAFFRFHAPSSMPPGPSHDELRMMDLGDLIVEGARPIHWKISYSAEPLFMYLLALAMPVWGFTPFGARLVTRFAGLLLIPVTHRLVRRLFGRRVALYTSGILAVTWWPMFFSRVALRGITLPLMFTAAVIFLWRGLGLTESGSEQSGTRVRWTWLVAGGALSGLTWYTFTAARGLVILLPVFLIYLSFLDLIPFRQFWRVSIVTLGAALIVAAPFIYEMEVHPGAPETRLDQLGGVIDQLLSGNPLPFARQAVNALGLFVATGDPNWRYNISGRPVFGPVLGASTVLGVVLSIGRWRQPRHALLIVWLLLGLAPSALTPEAPSFVRGIGALPVAAVFPAIGAVAVRDWVALHARPWVTRVVGLLLIALVLVNGVITFRDSFAVWRSRPEVREIYQVSLTEAFRDLSHSNLEGVLWISEPFPDDRHLLLAKRVLRRPSIKPRWFNANRALILPPADGARRYLLADFVEPDERLFGRWMMDHRIALLSGHRSSAESEGPVYQLYQVDGGPWVERELSEIMDQSTVYLDLGRERSLALPVHFRDVASVLGYEMIGDRLAPGGQVHLTVYWRVNRPIYEPLASFAHLLDERGEIVGQYDGFDVPSWHWEPGAVVAQVYRFSIDEDAEKGPHSLQIGLYHIESQKRLPVVDGSEETLGDRLVLEPVRLR